MPQSVNWRISCPLKSADQKNGTKMVLLSLTAFYTFIFILNKEQKTREIIHRDLTTVPCILCATYLIMNYWLTYMKCRRIYIAFVLLKNRR
jgi:hypothetical protein